MKYFIASFFFIFSFSALAVESNQKIDYLLKEKPLKDFTIITETSAIEVPPSEEEKEKMKKRSAEDLSVINDDRMFYTSKILEFLEPKKVKIIAVKTRYLIFVLRDKSEVYVDTKSLSWRWIFFNPKTPPKVLWPVDFKVDGDEDMKEFF